MRSQDLSSPWSLALFVATLVSLLVARHNRILAKRAAGWQGDPAAPANPLYAIPD